MRKFALVLIAGLLLGVTPSPAPAQCHIHKDEHVVLASSTTDDLSVLVWDTHLRLRDYHEGSFDEARQLAPHSMLVSPGTRAIVETCVPHYVQSPLASTPEDAVEVLLLTGSHRGSRGWVLGSDVHTTSH